VRGPPQLHRQCIRAQGFEAMPETTFTFRVDHELKKAFTEAARANYRPGSQLLRDFMPACGALSTTLGSDRRSSTA
jgi:hypothetical protein